LSIGKIIKTEVELPLSKKVVINLLYTENWLMDKINIVLKTYDISLQQFNVLRILKGQKGKPANLYTIQERMVTKMSNTTRLVDKLISKGYVKRVICESNRRKVEITITEQGKKFLEKVNPTIDEFENRITSGFSVEDLIQLNELLNKLRNSD
jgi:DNA-binding MarR family transcriptional regulator